MKTELVHKVIWVSLCLLIFVSKVDAGSLRDINNILLAEQNIREDNPQLGQLVETFLKNQKRVVDFQSSGLDNNEYLRLIECQVRAFASCQDKVTGAIIDPVYKIEWQYSTPCYALSIGLLAQTGYLKDDALVKSGIKALDCSVSEMHENRCAHHHGEFFIQPIKLAMDPYKGLVSEAQMIVWHEKMAEIDPYVLYRDNLKRKKICYNHNVVALAGEYLRLKKGVNDHKDFFHIHLEHQQQYMSEFGLYIDNKTNPPMVYDEFTRQFMASILAEGYNGTFFDFYSRKLCLGAWTSLFMQSPYGEVPTGGRSAQHIWNEAAAAVTYEIYASQYAALGKKQGAGAFKRAAHLALRSIGRWIREDGSGFIVKNRFPIEVMHGYESYSAQSQYNLLACWLMCVAYLYADNSIKESPSPSDIGGYVLVMKDVFHKVFANSGGNYVEYELSGDPRYNATGLIRIHLKNSNPQLGPSDGIPHKWDNKKKQDLGGELYAVGPEWHDAAGGVYRLAEYTNILFPDTSYFSAYKGSKLPEIDVRNVRQSVDGVAFEVVYTGRFDGVTQISQRVYIDHTGITVRDILKGNVKKVRACYPMLIDDGMEETKIDFQDGKVILQSRDGQICFQAISPPNATIQRKRKRIPYRNGYADIAYFESDKNVIQYKITTEF